MHSALYSSDLWAWLPRWRWHWGGIVALPTFWLPQLWQICAVNQKSNLGIKDHRNFKDRDYLRGNMIQQTETVLVQLRNLFELRDYVMKKRRDSTYPFNARCESSFLHQQFRWNATLICKCPTKPACMEWRDTWLNFKKAHLSIFASSCLALHQYGSRRRSKSRQERSR